MPPRPRLVLCLLSDRLSEARSARSEEVKARGVPAALLASAGQGWSNKSLFAATCESASGTKRTSDRDPMSAFGGKADIEQPLLIDRDL
jgi:hypothetical protein